MAAKPQARKLIVRTKSGFSQDIITSIPQPQYEILVDKLLKTLETSSIHVSPTKSKRRKKRKRESSTIDRSDTSPRSLHESQAYPEKSDILVGFNVVVRHLEALSAISGARLRLNQLPPKEIEQDKLRPIVAVFLFGTTDNIVFSHLPTLCYTASLAYQALPATRLIALNSDDEERIVQALGKPRSISLLAILEDVSGDDDQRSLIDYIRHHVSPTEVPWLQEALEGRWLGTSVDMDQV